MDNMEIRVPPLGESVTNATITRWYKKVGEGVFENDVVLELETDKVTLEVNAPATGTLAQISFDEGDAVNIGDVLGAIAVGGNIEAVVEHTFTEELVSQLSYEKGPRLPSKKSKGQKNNVIEPPYDPSESRSQTKAPHFVDEAIPAGPSVRKRIAEEGLRASDIIPTGRDGRVIKEDLILAEERRDLRLEEERLEDERRKLDHEKRQLMQERRHEDYHFHQRKSDFIDDEVNDILEEIDAPLSERRPMSALRRKIAERLKYAQNTAAILTTFNECDLTAVMQLRKLHQDAFTKKYGVKLGFMSFFVKACVHALKEIPSVNAEIDGDEMVFHKRYDIGIAVASSNGLVVPVLRNADKLALFEIEQEIAAYSEKAKTNKLTLSDLTGGTFTISNGGTFGSLCSTPILNPPQSAILGMHKIQERPVAMNGQVVIRPMMYLAVSYDHRIIDGREAVTFLVKIKDFLENPGQVLLGL